MNARELVDHVASRMGVDALELLDSTDREFWRARRAIYYFLWKSEWSPKAITEGLGVATEGTVSRLLKSIDTAEWEEYNNRWGLEEIQVLSPEPRKEDAP